MRRTIPTLLTILRLLLCPLVIYEFLEGHRGVAIILFIFSAATDLFDGHLARKWNVVSDIGAFLDPLVDKLFALSLFSLLMYYGICPMWFLGLSISITLLQCFGYSMLRFSRGSCLKASTSSLGKWSSAIQASWIGLLLLALTLSGQFESSFLLAGTLNLFYASIALLQILVLASYFLQFRSFLLPDVLRFPLRGIATED